MQTSCAHVKNNFYIQSRAFFQRVTNSSLIAAAPPYDQSGRPQIGHLET
jgi:hypothetical protein